MKKFLTSKKTLTILLVITILMTAFYTYMLARPISYGMEYYVNEKVAGYDFESSIVFGRDNKLVLKNSNFDEPLENYYYYKNGYVFYATIETEEEYKAAVEEINKDWEAAINKPFFATKINAFTLTNSIEDVTVVQHCQGAKTFAIAFGVLEVCLIALTVTAFVLQKKPKENV